MASHLADRFNNYRTRTKKLNLRDIAAKAEVNVATVWKLENDKPVSYKTFEKILIKGLGLTTRDKLYKEFQALWIGHRGEAQSFNIELAELIAFEELNKRQQKFLKRLAPIISNISTKDEDIVCEALSIPEIIEALPALIKLSQSSSSS